MALFSQDALNPGVRKREVFGWAMYDFANSGYTTVVITAVFAAYFVGGIAGKARMGHLRLDGGAEHLLRDRDAHHAQHRRLRRPARGQEAPAGAGHRWAAWSAPRRWPWPGRAAWRWPMVLVIVSNTFYSYGESLTAAFLPELARPESLGKVSGWGWGFGYFGGMLALGICLGYVLWAQAQGIPAGAVRAGHDADHGACCTGRPSLVTFRLLRERAQPNPAALRQGGLQGLAAAAAAHLRAGAPLPRLHVAAGLRGVLPGRRGGGDHAGRDLRRAA